jgi:hypothetical protein
MSRQSSSRPPAPNVENIVRDGAGADETAVTPTEVGGESQPGGNGRTWQPELVAIGGQHQPAQRRSPWPTRRRVGAVEYTLLALIALGVAITIVMAIVNP